MRISLIVLICALLSGCGLFRKKTNIKNSALVEYKSDIKESESEKAKLDVQQSQKVITLTDDKTKITTTVKGREIEITPTGIRCKDCEVEQREDKDLKKQTDSTALLNSNLYYAKEADRMVKESLKDETKNSNVVSEPKESSFIWWWIGIGLAACLVIWYIRRK